MILFMRSTNSPYLADWFAISLRWLAIFGLAISLGMGDSLSLPNVGILAISVVWNSYESTLAVFSRRMNQHRLVNIVFDSLFCWGLFLLADGLGGEIWWIAVLPLSISAVYYELRGALISALLISLVQVTMLFLVWPDAFNPRTAAMLVGFNLVTGLVFAAAATPFLRKLRDNYQNQVRQRNESERKARNQERERMKILFSMIETFSSTLNYQTVLETALDTSIAALGGSESEAGQIVSGVLLFNQNSLEIMANRRFFQSDLAVSLPAEQGILAETLKNGAYGLLQEPAKDPELSLLMTMDDQHTALCLPLIRSMNAYGVMLFAHSNPNYFLQERIDLLQMVSNQAVIAIQNARLYQDLAIEKERIVQSQEEAQKKLARDLHDGPTQSISSIAMRANIARKLLERSPQEAAEELARIEDLARRTTQEIRHMLFTLRPLVLETEGLEAALKTMSEKMRELFRQNIRIEVDPQVVSLLDPTRQMVIFYLSEEAVNNARKHAQATEIRLRLKFPAKETSIVMLEIIDNGVGFDVQSVFNSYERRGSLGMVNLRERTDQVNGLLKVDSVPGKGTCIRVYIPLNEEAADRLRQRR